MPGYIVCEVCKTEVYAKNISKKYCSKSCEGFSYRNRNKDKLKIMRRNNYLNSRVQTKQRISKWQSKHREQYNKICSDWKRNNKIKVNAHNTVHRDKKERPELYPQECCICGDTEKVEFHHPLYSFPLNVYPLCRQHHLQIHGKMSLNMEE